MLFTLGEHVRRELREFVVTAGITALAAVLESERTHVCGPRYAHQEGRRAHRSGHAPGELILGGRRVEVRRPRARTVGGHEVALPSWTAFADEDPLHERALQQMLVGVSTRKYERSLEAVPDGVRTRGTSKSAVSKRFVAKTKAEMDKWLLRDLSGLDIVVLMLDGVHVSEHVLLVALGIDSDGKKHVLGVREGATENATACRALLEDLGERGLRTDRGTLVVLDGSKALVKAVRDVYGICAVLQRCQVHKTRNIVDQLPDDMRPSVGESLRQAYRCGDVVRAKRLLTNLANRLRDEHPSAAASILEGLDETLTVMRFGLPNGLERVLSCTNAIENLIGSARDLGHRVKRWRGGSMILRWTATALIEASKKFRRVAGARGGMTKLVAALRRHDAVQTTLEVKVAVG
jgi:transposase-like protein